VAANPPTSIELMAISHEQLEDATQVYRRASYVQICALVVGGAAIFVNFQYSLALAIVVLALQGVSFYMRSTGQRKQRIGDEIRRRGLIMDALPEANQAHEMSELMRHLSDDIRRKATAAAAADYYASTSGLGAIRLVDHLRENVFWNKCLYSEAAARGSRLLAVFAFLVLLVVLLAIALASPDVTMITTRIAVALVTFLAAFAYVSDIGAWKASANSMDALDFRLDGLKVFPEKSLRNERLGELMVLFSEYTVATSKTLPIPRKVYLTHRDRLNRLWEEKESRASSGGRGGPTP
jgi:hypothetical protein